MATTTISFFSSFNKIKSSWFGNPFPHLKKPTTLVPLPMWHLLEEYLFIDWFIYLYFHFHFLTLAVKIKKTSSNFALLSNIAPQRALGQAVNSHVKQISRTFDIERTWFWEKSTFFKNYLIIVKKAKQISRTFGHCNARSWIWENLKKKNQIYYY